MRFSPRSWLAGITSSTLLVVTSIIFMAPGPAEASPAPPSTFFVASAPVGSNLAHSSGAHNSCTSKANPCATIAQAILAEGAASAVIRSHAIISLAKGVYDNPADAMFHGLNVHNDQVTITGAGTDTVIEPSACSALSASQTGAVAPRGSAFSESAIVNLTGLDGVTIENMTLSGGSVASQNCDNYRTAILSSGAGHKNSLVGLHVASGTTYAVQMENGSQTSISGDVVAPMLCATTTKGGKAGLKAGWSYNLKLAISKLPSCARGFTSVMINGVTYAAGAAGGGKVVLTGGPKPPSTPAIPRGSQVTFNTTVAAYTSVGIACNTLTQPLPSPTSCSVSSTTVSGGGTMYTSGGSLVGILVTDGATADLNGNKVAGNTEPTRNGIGIGLLPDTADGVTAGPTTVGYNESTNSGGGCNTVGNDISILATAFPSVSSSASWQINQNTVSGNEVGVLLSGLAIGSNVGSVSFSSNTVTNTLTGPGLELVNDNGAGAQPLTIGGSSSALGNSISHNAIGIAVTEGTTAVTFENNSITSNLAFGVAVDGADAMPEFLPGLSASSNTFVDNVWTGNGTPVSGTVNGGANVIDFGGFAFPSSAQSIGGSASAQSSNLALAAPIAAGTVPTTVTLVSASGTVEIGPGTLLTVSGYCASSTFTCSVSNVSLFVTSVGGTTTGVVGNVPVVVGVAPIAPAVAVPLTTVASGAAVSSNAQAVLTSSNSYGAGNSCTPVAPNSSSTLKDGTGGGPSGPDGSVTGYLAC
jgi:hypothetical protein